MISRSLGFIFCMNSKVENEIADQRHILCIACCSHSLQQQGWVSMQAGGKNYINFTNTSLSIQQFWSMINNHGNRAKSKIHQNSVLTWHQLKKQNNIYDYILYLSLTAKIFAKNMYMIQYSSSNLQLPLALDCFRLYKSVKSSGIVESWALIHGYGFIEKRNALNYSAFAISVTHTRHTQTQKMRTHKEEPARKHFLLLCYILLLVFC